MVSAIIGIVIAIVIAVIIMSVIGVVMVVIIIGVEFPARDSLWLGSSSFPSITLVQQRSLGEGSAHHYCLSVHTLSAGTVHCQFPPGV